MRIIGSSVKNSSTDQHWFRSVGASITALIMVLVLLPLVTVQLASLPSNAAATEAEHCQHKTIWVYTGTELVEYSTDITATGNKITNVVPDGRGIAVSPDNKQLYVINKLGTIYVYSSVTRNLIHTITPIYNSSDPVDDWATVSFYEKLDNTRVLLIGAGSNATIVKIAVPTVAELTTPKSSPAAEILVNKDAGWALEGYAGGMVTLGDGRIVAIVKRGTARHFFAMQYDSNIRPASVHVDSRIFAATNTDIIPEIAGVAANVDQFYFALPQGEIRNTDNHPMRSASAALSTQVGAALPAGIKGMASAQNIKASCNPENMRLKITAEPQNTPDENPYQSAYTQQYLVSITNTSETAPLKAVFPTIVLAPDPNLSFDRVWWRVEGVTGEEAATGDGVFAKPQEPTTLQIFGKISAQQTATVKISTTFVKNVPAAAALPCNGAGTGLYAQIGTGRESSALPAEQQTCVAAPPPGPSLLSGATVPTRTPELTGRGEPGAELVLYSKKHARKIISTIIKTDGTWSLTVPKYAPPAYEGEEQQEVLETGDNELQLWQITLEKWKTVKDFISTVDDVPPGSPVILLPENNSKINNSSPVISGTAEPKSFVEIAGLPHGTGCAVTPVQATVAGAWSCKLASPLADGSYNLSVTVKDAVGNISPQPAAVSFTIDTIAPKVSITSPANNTVTNKDITNISGESESDKDTISITINEKPVLCTSLTWAAQVWTCQLAENLTVPGEYRISALATDQVGNVSQPGQSTIVIDKTPPGGASVTYPLNNSIINIKQPVITGKGEPGATVLLQGFPAGTNCVPEQPKVRSDGIWGCTLSAPLPDGQKITLITQAKDQAGSFSGESEYSFTVSSTAPNAPEISAPAEGAVITSGTFTLSGHAQPGARILVAGLPASSNCGDYPVIVSTDSSWSCTIAQELGAGKYQLGVSAVDAAGNVSAVVNRSITMRSQTLAVPVWSSPTEQATLATKTPTLTGQATPGAAITISGLPEQVTCSVAETDETGVFSCTPSSELPDGKYSLNIVASKPDYLPATSVLRTVTIDTTAPNAPEFTMPLLVGAKAITTITGTGEVGSEIGLRSDGVSAECSRPIIVDPQGKWSCQLTKELAAGQNHILTASQVDKARNISEVKTITIVADAIAPQPPEMTLVYPSAVVNPSNGIMLQGTAEAGAKIKIAVSNYLNSFCVTNSGSPDVVVGNDGKWFCTLLLRFASNDVDPNFKIVDGAVQITAQAIDELGNISDKSAVIPLILDTTPPVFIHQQGKIFYVGEETHTYQLQATDLNNIKDYPNPSMALPTEKFAHTFNPETGSISISANNPGRGSVSYIARDTADNQDSKAALRIDYFAVARTVLNDPNESSTDNRPIFSGTKVKNSDFGGIASVKVLVDGVHICSPDGAVADTTEWSCKVGDHDLAKALSPGTHTVKARTTYTAIGAETLIHETEAKTFTVQPPMLKPAPIQRLVVGQSWSGYDVKLEETEVDLLGNSFSAVDLPEGISIDVNSGKITGTPMKQGKFHSHIFLTDEFGFKTSTPMEFDIREKITITSPSDTATLTNSQPKITGTGTPGHDVKLRDNDKALDLECISAAKTDFKGEWSCVPKDPLVFGAHKIVALYQDGSYPDGSLNSNERSFGIGEEHISAGAVTVVAGSQFSITIGGNEAGTFTYDFTGEELEGLELTPTTLSASATLTGIGKTAGSHLVTLKRTVADPSKTTTTTVEITVVAKLAGPPSIGITSASTVNRPVFTGVGVADSQVTVQRTDLSPAVELCSVTVAADGNWTCTAQPVLPAGEIKFVAVATLGTQETKSAEQSHSITTHTVTVAGFDGPDVKTKTIFAQPVSELVIMPVQGDDGDELTYFATRLPAGIKIEVTQSGQVNIAGSTAEYGVYPTKIIAIDKYGFTAETEFVFYVVPQLEITARSENEYDNTPWFAGFSIPGAEVTVTGTVVTGADFTGTENQELCKVTVPADGHWRCEYHNPHGLKDGAQKVVPKVSINGREIHGTEYNFVIKPGKFTVSPTPSACKRHVNGMLTYYDVPMRTFFPGQEILLKVSTTDPDVNTVKYKAENLPYGITIDEQTGVIAGTLPLDSENTPYVTPDLKLKITDGYGNKLDPAPAVEYYGEKDACTKYMISAPKYMEIAYNSEISADTHVRTGNKPTFFVGDDKFLGRLMLKDLTRLKGEQKLCEISRFDVNMSGQSCTPTEKIPNGERTITAHRGTDDSLPAIPGISQSFVLSPPTFAATSPLVFNSGTWASLTIKGGDSDGGRLELTGDKIPPTTESNWVLTANGGASPSASIAGTPTTPGVYPLTLTWIDPYEYAGSINFEIIVNGAPTITAIASGAPATSDNTPTVSGTGVPGATIIARSKNENNESATLCATTVAANGAWACTPSAALINGTYDITATSSFAGVEALESPVEQITITNPELQLVAQTIPVGTTFSLPVISNDPDNLSYKFDPQPTLLGPEDTIVIDPSTGVITGELTRPGDYQLNIKATDSYGNSNAASVVLTVVQKPVFTTPENNSTSLSNKLRFTGNSAPGAIILIKESGATVCAAVATNQGTWECIPPRPWRNGAHTVIATAILNGQALDSTPATVTIAPTQLAIPKIKLSNMGGTVQIKPNPTDPAGTDKDQVEFSAQSLPEGLVLNRETGEISGTPAASGRFDTTVTATDAFGNIATEKMHLVVQAQPAITNPVLLRETRENKPTFAGTGTVGAQIKVKENGTEKCSAIVSPASTWECTPQEAFAAGTHRLIATSTVTEAINFTSKGFAALAASQNELSFDGVEYTLSVTGPELTVTPKQIINQGDSVNIQATADDPDTPITFALIGQPAGNPALTINKEGKITGTPTETGIFSLQIIAKDNFGSETTKLVLLIVQMTPSITGPETTQDNKPTISGNGTPGAEITVKDNNGTTVCTAIVDSNGTWKCTATDKVDNGSKTWTAESNIDGVATPPGKPFTSEIVPSKIVLGDKTINQGDDIAMTASSTDQDVPLVWAGLQLPAGTTIDSATGVISGAVNSPGIHQVQVSVTDAYHNTSQATAQLTVQAKPVITSPAAGASSQNNIISFTGTGSPSAAISVKDTQQTELCTATVTNSGNWQCTTAALPAGQYSCTALSTLNTINNPSAVIAITIAGPTINASNQEYELGQQVKYQVQASDPDVPLHYAAAGLPDGLSISADSGEITGTPSKTGTFSTSITVRDKHLSSTSVTIQIKVVDTVSPEVNLPPKVTLEVGVQVQNLGISATGKSPLNYSAIGLPPGLTLDPNTGQIAGTPTKPGISNVEIIVKDQSGNETKKTFTLVVLDTQPPTIDHIPDVSVKVAVPMQPIELIIKDLSCPANPAGFTAGSESIPAGTPAAVKGCACATVTVQGLPVGISFDPATALISGTPGTVGVYSITVIAKDDSGNSASRTFRLAVTNVNPPRIDNDNSHQTIIDGASPPMINGSGEPGTDIEIRDESGKVICRTKVAPDGHWSCVIKAPLKIGDNKFNIYQIDQNGNSSAGLPYVITKIKPDAGSNSDSDFTDSIARTGSLIHPLTLGTVISMLLLGAILLRRTRTKPPRTGPSGWGV